MSSPIQIIEGIRKRGFGIDLDTTNISEEIKEYIEDSKRFKNDAARLASDLHTEQPHFILELIQNAEDNDYDKDVVPTVKFIVQEDKFIVQNNEKGFSEENVRALCGIGASTKRNKKMGYIGEKGIGFKSVFKVSSEPYIFSNGFQFKFTYDEKNPISIIIPSWVEDIPNFVDLGQTNIVLPLKDEVKSEVSKFIEIDPCLLLFLRKLKFIEVVDKIKQRSCLIKRYDADSKVTIEHPKGEDYWRIIKNSEPLKVPQDIKEERRRDIEQTEIILAFPLKSDGSADTSKEQNLFVYLPVRSYGFKFIIQADFLVPPSREHIHKDKLWNKWLRDSIADVFLIAVEEFKSDEKLKNTYYNYIPLANEISDPFFSPVVEQIQNKLRQTRCILTESMNWLKPTDVLRVDDDIRELIPNDDLKTFFGKEYIALDIKVNKQILDVLGVSEFGFNHLVQCLQNKEWLENKSNDWFVRLYSYLNNQKLKEEQLQKLKHLKIIRLENNELTSVAEGPIFFPLDKEGNYEFEMELRVVNRTFIAEKDKEIRDAIAEFFKKLGICDAHPYEIIENHILPIYRSGRWRYKDDKTLLGYIRYIKDNLHSYEKESDRRLNANKGIWEPKKDPLKPLKDSLFVRINTNDYDHPENVYFSKSYGNDNDLESLFEGINGIFFVHREYIEDIIKKYRQIKRKSKKNKVDIYKKREAEVKEWREFFQKIGIEDKPRVILDPETVRKNDYLSGLKKIWHKQNPNWEYSNDGYYIEDDYICPDLEKIFNNISSKKVNILIQIFDANWNYYKQKLECRYWYHKPYAKYWNKSSSESSFALLLKNSFWLPTSKGNLAKPSGVFLNKPEIKELLGDTVPYLTIDLKNKEFIKALGINSEANVSGVLNYLHTLPAQNCKDKDIFAKLYNFLNKKYEDNEDNIKNAFLEHKIIYIPDSNQNYFSSKEVIWKDVSEIFGETRGYLEKHYLTLKSFFVNKLCISEKPTPRDYANVLIDISKKKIIKNSDEKIILKIYSELNNYLNPKINEYLISQEDWWQDFINESIFWTDKNEFWKNNNNVFIKDDLELYQLFKDNPQIAFLKLRDDYYYPKIQYFITNAGISYLSKAVKVRLGTIEGARIEEDLTQQIRSFLPYIPRYLYKFEQDSYENLKKDETLMYLKNLTVWSVENLQVEYILNEHAALGSRNAVFYNGNLYIRNDCLEETYYLAVEISKIFGEIRGLDDFLILLFNKRSKDAIEKLLKARGIGELPEDEAKWVEELKGIQEEPTGIIISSTPISSETQKDYKGTAKETTKDTEWCPECKPTEVEIRVEELQPLKKPERDTQKEKSRDEPTQPPQCPEEETGEGTLSPGAETAIGRWGEEYALKYLKESLSNKYPEGKMEKTSDSFTIRLGKQLIVKVQWLNASGDRGEGYDIEMIENGVKKYIEVKSTKTDKKEWFDLSRKQWEIMTQEKDKFHIYRVYNAGTKNAKLIIITNPYKMWQEGNLTAYPVRIII